MREAREFRSWKFIAILAPRAWRDLAREFAKIRFRWPDPRVHRLFRAPRHHL